MSNGQPDKVVNITLNSSGLPVPDQDPIQVKKDNQKIKWCADFQFTVSIDGYSDVNYGTGGNPCAFSAKTGYFTTAAGTHYKYSITANGQTNDPGIDVEP